MLVAISMNTVTYNVHRDLEIGGTRVHKMMKSQMSLRWVHAIYIMHILSPIDEPFI